MSDPELYHKVLEEYKRTHNVPISVDFPVESELKCLIEQAFQSDDSDSIKFFQNKLKQKFCELLQWNSKLNVHQLGIEGNLPALKRIAKSLTQERFSELLAGQDAFGRTPLHWASYKCHVNVVQYILQTTPNSDSVTHADTNGNTILHSAAYNSDNSKVIDAILKHASDVQRATLLKTLNHRGCTPVHFAVLSSSPASITALTSCSPYEEKVELLQIRNIIGQTPLHNAATRGSKEMVDCLLKDMTEEDKVKLLKVQDNTGCTSVQLAAEERSYEVFKTLLEHVPSQDRQKLLRVEDEPQKVSLSNSHKRRLARIAELIRDFLLRVETKLGEKEGTEVMEQDSPGPVTSGLDKLPKNVELNIEQESRTSAADKVKVSPLAKIFQDKLDGFQRKLQQLSKKRQKEEQVAQGHSQQLKQLACLLSDFNNFLTELRLQKAEQELKTSQLEEVLDTVTSVALSSKRAEMETLAASSKQQELEEVTSKLQEVEMQQKDQSSELTQRKLKLEEGEQEIRKLEFERAQTSLKVDILKQKQNKCEQRIAFLKEKEKLAMKKMEQCQNKIVAIKQNEKPAVTFEAVTPDEDNDWNLHQQIEKARDEVSDMSDLEVEVDQESDESYQATKKPSNTEKSKVKNKEKNVSLKLTFTKQATTAHPTDRSAVDIPVHSVDSRTTHAKPTNAENVSTCKPAAMENTEQNIPLRMTLEIQAAAAPVKEKPVDDNSSHFKGEEEDNKKCCCCCHKFWSSLMSQVAACCPNPSRKKNKEKSSAKNTNAAGDLP